MLSVPHLEGVKPETITAWQLKTYEASVNAYESVLANYNEQVAAAQIQSGVEIQIGLEQERRRSIKAQSLVR